MSAFSAGEVGSGPIDNGAAADGVARGASSSRWSVSLCPYPLTCMNVGTTKRIAKMIIVIEIARRLCGSTGRRVPNGFAEVASGVGGSEPSIGPFTSTCASIATSTIVASSSTWTVDDPFVGEDVRLMTTQARVRRATVSIASAPAASHVSSESSGADWQRAARGSWGELPAGAGNAFQISARSRRTGTRSR